MIDLSQSPAASPAVHAVAEDPGRVWVKEARVAIDAPPDSETSPAPEARWPGDAPRTGLCGAVSPRVVRMHSGGYRLYYTQILPRAGFPQGANDYDNATTRILSAVSSDGRAWTPERGVRLAPGQGGHPELRVVSSEVVPIGGAPGRLRMYYESCPGRQSEPSVIRSAVSDDGGLAWTVEPGARFETGRYLCAPRIAFLDGGWCRLYCYERDRGIVSALSDDGGRTFRQEDGVRVAPDSVQDALTAFAPEIVRLPDGGYVMYYAGYAAPTRAAVLRATSADGLAWRKEAEPAIAPGEAGWDRAKASEMCLYALPASAGDRPRYRMVYEACDGTAPGARGVWRLAAATAAG